MNKKRLEKEFKRATKGFNSTENLLIPGDEMRPFMTGKTWTERRRNRKLLAANRQKRALAEINKSRLREPGAGKSAASRETTLMETFAAAAWKRKGNMREAVAATVPFVEKHRRSYAEFYLKKRREGRKK